MSVVDDDDDEEELLLLSLVLELDDVAVPERFEDDDDEFETLQEESMTSVVGYFDTSFDDVLLLLPELKTPAIAMPIMATMISGKAIKAAFAAIWRDARLPAILPRCLPSLLPSLPS